MFRAAMTWNVAGNPPAFSTIWNTPADEAARPPKERRLANLGRAGLERRRLPLERLGVAFQAVLVVGLGVRQATDAPGQAAHVARLLQQVDDFKFRHALSCGL
jgi:hypothetical protein